MCMYVVLNRRYSSRSVHCCNGPILRKNGFAKYGMLPRLWFHCIKFGLGRDDIGEGAFIISVGIYTVAR